MDYLALVGRNGIILTGEEFQFCEKAVDLAGFRRSGQEVVPWPKYLESRETFPTPKTGNNARVGSGLMHQVDHHAQLRDMAASLTPSVLPEAKVYGTNELRESFKSSEQLLVEARTHGVVRGPI